MTIVVDSWAVLAYLHDRMPGSALVADLLDHEQPVMSWINLGEVFYIVRRREGETRAMTVIRDLWTGDPELMLAGAEWRWRDLRDAAAN